MYRYYLTQRPAAPGAFPVVQDNPVVEAHNYDRRTFVPEIRCQAWGYIEYRKQLELYNVAIYELIEAPAGDGLMKDRNRKKIRTGDVVKVTGALPEEDNGLFFVERSPRDPNWASEIYCLMRLCEDGHPSTAERNIAYWPNPNGQADTAKIEIVADFPALGGLVQYFEDQIKAAEEREESAKGKDFEGSWTEGYCSALRDHYSAIIGRIRKRMEGNTP